MIQDRSSEGPYKDGDVIDVGGRVSKWVLNGYSEVKIANVAHAEGRKVVQIKTPCPSCGFTTLCVDDSGNLVCSFLECKNPTEIANKEGRKVAEKEYEAKIGLDYTISTSVKLAAFNKLENDFRDLFNIANEMSMNLDSFTDEAGNCHIKFHAWKKARGIE